MRIVEWNEYGETLRKLHNELISRTFDGIVTIGRGGSIVGAYLASKMGIPSFCPVFVRHMGKGKEMRIIVHDLCQVKSLSGRLLVVDDWLDDGVAMRYVLDLIPKTAMVSTLALYCRSGASFKPDFVGTYVDEAEREILFPYDPL